MAVMERVGMTTTVPIEVIYAAGEVPVDLNNIFITDPDPEGLLVQAEMVGFPRSSCGWIKGIYSVARKRGIRRGIAVTQGDCSNTHALIEVLQMEGAEVFPFAFPYDRDRGLLEAQLERMMEHFGVSWEEVREEKERLDRVRSKAHEIDRLCWQEGRVSGFEDHYFLVNTSDMKGDPEGYEREMEEFLREARSRTPYREEVRLGFVGIPPIFTDFYQFFEEHGARVVFNEIQRQFSMPFQTDDLVEQYLLYTYPYSFFFRLQDIKREVKRREVDGVIHYVQAFCFRQIQDIILRKELDLPILTVEGDRPIALDGRTKLRLESFLEMLRQRKGRWV